MFNTCVLFELTHPRKENFLTHLHSSLIWQQKNFILDEMLPPCISNNLKKDLAPPGC